MTRASHAATVSVEQQREFIGLLHDTLRETARDVLPSPSLHTLVPRLAFVDGRVVGHISTQFGAGIEYLGGDEHSIEIHVGSGRIEDLIVRTPRYLRAQRLCLGIQGHHTRIVGTVVDGFNPIRLETPRADVQLIGVTFRDTIIRPERKWSHLIPFAELYANRTSSFWSRETAIVRAKDEVIAGLTDLRVMERRSVGLEEYMAQFKQRTVLVLGDYGDAGRTRLEAVAQGLRVLGYEPVLLSEIPDLPDYDLAQKAVAIGSVVRFVVVEDSTPSGHLFEVPYVRNNSWVTIILREKGKRSSFMTAGSALVSTVVSEHEYTPHDLAQVLETATGWAEDRVADLANSRQNIYPWR